MPLLARAPATNDHPWSTHGGFIRQVRPDQLLLLLLSLLCRASSTCRVVLTSDVDAISADLRRYLFVLIPTLGDRCVWGVGDCVGRL